jgi:hypothetical protein
MLYRFSLVFFLWISFAFEFKAQAFFKVEDLKKHVTYLASDELEGRGTGTKGELKAAKYIAKNFKQFKLTPKGDKKSYFQKFPFSSTGFHGNVTRKGIATNVIGFLNNNAAFTIVIGAHYDHLGMNEDGHSLDAEGKGKIHNGADDNASGVAGVIELARYFSTNNVSEPFNFLFICFSAEELGLLGSKYFCEHPTLSLDSVTAMINMDMIGRLKKEDPVLTISGTGTSPVWESILSKFNSNALRIRFDSSGIGPSDHTSFYKKNIPALHFFSGTHADYHKPSDDAHLLNYNGQEAILFLISELINQLPSNEKLTFLTTKTNSTTSVSKFKVTLGIMPSYAETGKGLEVEAVIDGKPAQKAGVKNGDVIIQIGEYAVSGIQDYMDSLSKFNKGDKTSVKLKRGSEVITLSVEF